jgi:hypothetical protein
MPEEAEIRELQASEQRALATAAALAREQLRYACAIAQQMARPGEEPAPEIVGALVQAMAANYAAVK